MKYRNKLYVVDPTTTLAKQLSKNDIYILDVYFIQNIQNLSNFNLSEDDVVLVHSKEVRKQLKGETVEDIIGDATLYSDEKLFPRFETLGSPLDIHLLYKKMNVNDGDLYTYIDTDNKVFRKEIKENNSESKDNKRKQKSNKSSTKTEANTSKNNKDSQNTKQSNNVVVAADDASSVFGQARDINSTEDQEAMSLIKEAQKEKLSRQKRDEQNSEETDSASLKRKSSKKNRKPSSTDNVSLNDESEPQMELDGEFIDDSRVDSDVDPNDYDQFNKEAAKINKEFDEIDLDSDFVAVSDDEYQEAINRRDNIQEENTIKLDKHDVEEDEDFEVVDINLNEFEDDDEYDTTEIDLDQIVADETPDEEISRREREAERDKRFNPEKYIELDPAREEEESFNRDRPTGISSNSDDQFISKDIDLEILLDKNEVSDEVDISDTLDSVTIDDLGDGVFSNTNKNSSESLEEDILSVDSVIDDELDDLEDNKELEIDNFSFDDDPEDTDSDDPFSGVGSFQQAADEDDDLSFDIFGHQDENAVEPSDTSSGSSSFEDLLNQLEE